MAFKIPLGDLAKALICLLLIRPIKWDGNELKGFLREFFAQIFHCRLALANG
jgi:hypothetical protein